MRALQARHKGGEVVFFNKVARWVMLAFFSFCALLEINVLGRSNFGSSLSAGILAAIFLAVAFYSWNRPSIELFADHVLIRGVIRTRTLSGSDIGRCYTMVAQFGLYKRLGLFIDLADGRRLSLGTQGLSARPRSDNAARLESACQRIQQLR
jgi:hypothetical protein